MVGEVAAARVSCAPDGGPEGVAGLSLDGSTDGVPIVGDRVAGRAAALGLGGLGGAWADVVGASGGVAGPVFIGADGGSITLRLNVLVDEGVKVSLLREQVKIVHYV